MAHTARQALALAATPLRPLNSTWAKLGFVSKPGLRCNVSRPQALASGALVSSVFSNSPDASALRLTF